MQCSIVICTRNRARELKECLSSLLREGSETPREVLVVNNGSTDDTDSVVGDFAEAAPFSVVSLHEPVPGLSRARNRGVRGASAPVVAFTDDDVLVQAGWVDALVKPFADSSVAGVGGRVKPLFSTEPPVWLRGPWANMVALNDQGDAPLELSKGSLLIGANMALRRELLGDSPFAEELGHRDGRLVGHEESALFSRLSQWKWRYEPGAVVLHVVDEARLTLAFARRSAFHNGFGTSRQRRMSGRGEARGQALLRIPHTVASCARWRLRNRIRGQSDVAAVHRELAAYRDLGERLDAAIGSGSADWLSELMLRLA